MGMRDRGEHCACLSFRAWVSREQLGDYGYFSDSGLFSLKGNIFVDLRSLISEVDITPSQLKVATITLGMARVDNLGLSLPNNRAFNSSLASFSPRLTNACLVTRVVQCHPSGSQAHTLCSLFDGSFSFDI